MDNYIYSYYQKIQDGSEVVGNWIRLLYEKIVRGIEDGTYVFDQNKANRVIQFFEKFVRHNKGKLAPEVISLSLWQKASLSIMYGVVDSEGHRQFKEIVWVVGRKCGKTLVASGLICYEAYCDGDFGSEIYCVAPKLDQSDLVFSAYEFTKDKTPAFEKLTKKRKVDYYIQKTNTTIKKIAFNEKKADGYNPMLVVADEISSWPAERGLKQYEVLESGTTAREEPIIFSISSAGYVNEGIYDELFKRGTSFLLGSSSETRLLPIFYTIDDLEKWDDINELRKSLPGLGTSVKVDTILDEINIAHESLSKRAEFITKYCNIKQSSSQAWLPAEVVQSSSGKHMELDDFRGSYCVAGIDLSQTTDLTAAIIMIEKDGEFYVFAKFWLPSAKIDEAIERDGLPYRIYIQRGLLEESGENFVDYGDCYRWISSMIPEHEIYPLMIGYDRYSAQYLVQSLNNDGFRTDDCYQGDNMWPLIQWLEGTMKDGKIHIGDNDLLKVHLLNSAIKMSAERGRGRLVKMSPNAHVDGTAALLDAIAVRSKYYDEIGELLSNRSYEE